MTTFRQTQARRLARDLKQERGRRRRLLNAAAPDLLAACETALRFVDAALEAGVRIPSDLDPTDDLRVAIARAKGGAS
jgi:hypothetical protein